MRKLTKQQREWMKNFEADTGFDCIYIEEYLNEEISFYEFGWKNLNWFEQWANDAHRFASEGIPEDE